MVDDQEKLWGGGSPPNKSPYEILGVSSESSQADIEDAYARARRQLQGKLERDTKYEGIPFNPEPEDVFQKRLKLKTLATVILDSAYKFVNSPRARDQYSKVGYAFDPLEKQKFTGPSGIDWSTKWQWIKNKRVPVEDAYSILGVSKSSTTSEINSALKKKLAEAHPDQVEKTEDSRNWYNLYQEAGAVLTDESLRKDYDSGGWFGVLPKAPDSDQQADNKDIRRHEEIERALEKVHPMARKALETRDSVYNLFAYDLSGWDTGPEMDKAREGYAKYKKQKEKEDSRRDSGPVPGPSECTCEYPVINHRMSGVQTCTRCGKPRKLDLKSIDLKTDTKLKFGGSGPQIGPIR
jgi:curved DNA-binding protein CbpA